MMVLHFWPQHGPIALSVIFFEKTSNIILMYYIFFALK